MIDLYASINSQHAYTTIAPPDTTTNTNAAVIPTIPGLNFSGHSTPTAPSIFTVAGWVRVGALPDASTWARLFWTAGQFGLAIDNTGALNVWFGGYGDRVPVIATPPAIADTEWHYVAVTCQPGATGTESRITIALDGVILADDVKTIPASGGNAAFYYLGAGALEFVSWSIWSRALDDIALEVPDFGPPTATSPDDQDLAAAFNFATGPAHDVSGHNRTVEAHAGPTYWPRLRLASRSSFTPATSEQASFFGRVSTLMTWLQLPREFPAAILTLAKAGDDALTLSGTGQLWLTLGAASIPIGAIVPGTVIHLAAEIIRNPDGSSTLSVWLNGNYVGRGTTALAAKGPVPAEFLINQTPFDIAAQGLSIWNRALNPLEILADYQGKAFDNLDGLLAGYPLQQDLKDLQGGGAATVHNAQIVDVVDDTSVASGIAAALGARAGEPVETEGAFRFPRLSEVAGASGVADSTLPADVDASVEELGGSIADEAMRAHVTNQLRLGHALWSSGVKTGTIETSHDSGHTVFVYHAPEGPVEFLRVEGTLDPLTEWTIVIITDVIAILGIGFGITTEPGKLANGVRLVMAAMPTIRNALIDGLNKGQISTGAAVIAVVNEIRTAGLLLPLIKALVSG
ncbi:hypothetical protein DBR17_03760, partial [Sphingomonas sp. HMWF008]